MVAIYKGSGYRLSMMMFEIIIVVVFKNIFYSEKY